MKASELMVGDFARVTEDVCIKKGTIVEIVGIDATRTLPKHDLVGCALCTPLNHDDGLYGGYGGVWTAFLEPIPLTAEILEKIGFTRDPLWHHCDKDFGNYTISVQLGYGNKIEYIKIVEKGVDSVVPSERTKMYLTHIEYIHELQHAMRLCGIDKKINI